MTNGNFYTGTQQSNQHLAGSHSDRSDDTPFVIPNTPALAEFPGAAWDSGGVTLGPIQTAHTHSRI